MKKIFLALCFVLSLGYVTVIKADSSCNLTVTTAVVTVATPSAPATKGWMTSLFINNYSTVTVAVTVYDSTSAYTNAATTTLFKVSVPPASVINSSGDVTVAIYPGSIMIGKNDIDRIAFTRSLRLFSSIGTVAGFTPGVNVIVGYTFDR
jgi:hypothetical protein